MQKTLKTPGLALIAAVNTINFSSPTCVGDAVHVRRTATEMEIEPKSFDDVLMAIDKKLAQVADNTDDGAIEIIYAELSAAKAGVLAQVEIYRIMLNKIVGFDTGANGTQFGLDDNQHDLGLDETRAPLDVVTANPAGGAPFDATHAVHQKSAG